MPTCYRHADRQTGLSCTTCGKPICVECSIDSAVGQKCPDDATPEGRARVITAGDIRRRSTQVPPVTLFLLVASAVVYVLGALSPELERTIFDNGALFPALVRDGDWYRLVSSAFLHAGLYHILFNMWALWILGPGIEREVGSVPFAGLYLASAMVGSVAYVLAESSTPAVGASGAVFGLFGAWLASAWKRRSTPAGRANLQSIGIILGLNLMLPFVVEGIAWEAHVGGLLAGFAIAFAWTTWGRDVRTRSILAFAVAALGLAIGILL